nr:cysteine-rich venom protein helothermine-like [Dermacentor andersoni]
MTFAKVALGVFLATFASGVGAEDQSVLRSMLAAFAKQAAQDCEPTPDGRNLGDEDKVELVKKHNEYRARVAGGGLVNFPKATNMMKLDWNNELAAHAQATADKCDPTARGKGTALDPGSFTGVHQIQDSAAVPATQPKAAPFKGAHVLQTWFDGSVKLKPADLNKYADQTDAEAERFAQLIWAETRSIGCGYKQFKLKSRPSDPTKEILVCDYHPGLKTGAPVYKQGEPCSDCGSDFECDVTKLCVEKAKTSTSGQSRIDGSPSLVSIIGIGAGVIICVAVVICLVVMHTRRRRTATGAATAAELVAGGSNESAGGDAAGAEDHKTTEAAKMADNVDQGGAAASHEALAKK